MREGSAWKQGHHDGHLLHQEGRDEASQGTCWGGGERDSKNHFKLLLKMTVMGYGGDSQRTHTLPLNPSIWMAAPHMYIVCQNPVKHSGVGRPKRVVA